MSTIERAEVVGRINDLRAEVRDDIGEIKGAVIEIRALVAEMRQENGRRVGALSKRVRMLELWRARTEGMRAAFEWLPALVAGLLGSGVTAAVTLLLAH